MNWARVCPGNNQSGGRRRPGRHRQGNPHLRSALMEAAPGALRAGRRQPNFFSARYHRLVVRRGS